MRGYTKLQMRKYIYYFFFYVIWSFKVHVCRVQCKICIYKCDSTCVRWCFNWKMLTFLTVEFFFIFIQLKLTCCVSNWIITHNLYFNSQRHHHNKNGKNQFTHFNDLKEYKKRLLCIYTYFINMRARNCVYARPVTLSPSKNTEKKKSILILFVFCARWQQNDMRAPPRNDKMV